MSTTLRICLEVGKKKAFAVAIDHPGWCRCADTPQTAMGTLIAYRERYNAVLALGRVRQVPADTSQVEIVQTVPGSGRTEFGVPDVAFGLEARPLEGPELERAIRIVRASWTYLDQTAAGVSEVLRREPRRGGRDRSKILTHVLQRERSYVHSLGVRSPRMTIDDRDAITAHRDAVAAAIERYGKTGDALSKPWSLRFCVRRIVWHTLDHAWEMEDKDLSETG